MYASWVLVRRISKPVNSQIGCHHTLNYTTERAHTIFQVEMKIKNIVTWQ